jgi:poly(A) polymerase
VKIEDFLSLFGSMIKGSSFATRTWLVGGVVRDLQLGYDDFVDFDLCIEQPFGGLRLAKYLQNRGIPQTCEIFERFGTARLSLEGITLDLVASRSETYHSGKRYPKIRYAPIKEDVWRRDFTINALYMSVLDRRIIDPSGMGFADISARRIRCLREPMTVFSEDALRILRALRFAATFGFVLEESTSDALARCVHLIKRLSKKAWSLEMQKLREKGIFEEAFKLYAEYGVQRYVPEEFSPLRQLTD